jgi:hypothetical protein
VANYKDIIGFPGYKVGDDGSVWGSLPNNRYPKGVWRRLQPAVKEWGHLTLRLTRGGKGHNRMVHRLVLEAFVGPCPPTMEACHSDGNPANNRLENLRWDTKAANAQDKIRHGTQAKGEKNGAAILSRCQVLDIKRLLKLRVRGTQIAAKYGVTKSTVSAIAVGRIWSWLEEGD